MELNLVVPAVLFAPMPLIDTDDLRLERRERGSVGAGGTPSGTVAN